MTIIVREAEKKRLLELGVSSLNAVPFLLPDDCTFEPPCSIKWMSIQYALHMGSFSYAVSGYYFGSRIGRYTSIGEDVQVGRGSHPVSWASTSPLFYQPNRDVFDFDCSQAAGFKLNAPYIHPKRTVIGNDVYIGHGAIIMQGVTIGDGAVVGAGSVVTKDVPPYAIVAGAPASVRKMRFDEAIIERMLRLRWWQYAFWEFSGVSVSEPNAFLDLVEEKAMSGMKSYQPTIVSARALSE